MVTSNDILTFINNSHKNMFYYSIFFLFVIFNMNLILFGSINMICYTIKTFSPLSLLIGYTAHHFYPWKRCHTNYIVSFSKDNYDKYYTIYASPYIGDLFSIKGRNIKSIDDIDVLDDLNTKANNDTVSDNVNDSYIQNKSTINNYNLRQRKSQSVIENQTDTQNTEEEEITKVSI